MPKQFSLPVESKQGVTPCTNSLAQETRRGSGRVGCAAGAGFGLCVLLDLPVSIMFVCLQFVGSLFTYSLLGCFEMLSFGRSFFPLLFMRSG